MELLRSISIWKHEFANRYNGSKPKSILIASKISKVDFKEVINNNREYDLAKTMPVAILSPLEENTDTQKKYTL